MLSSSSRGASCIEASPMTHDPLTIDWSSILVVPIHIHRIMITPAPLGHKTARIQHDVLLLYQKPNCQPNIPPLELPISHQCCLASSGATQCPSAVKSHSVTPIHTVGSRTRFRTASSFEKIRIHLDSRGFREPRSANP